MSQFVYLNPTDPTHKAIIDQIKNGALEKIDEHTFPIDVAGKKIGNISVEAVKQSVNNNVFAPGVFAVGAEKSADVDAFILVIYYNVKGQAANAAEISSALVSCTSSMLILNCTIILRRLLQVVSPLICIG